MSKLSEFYGLNCQDDSIDFLKAHKLQICPFTKRLCTKTRKSDSQIKIGACTIKYQNNNVIICPFRLLESQQNLS